MWNKSWGLSTNDITFMCLLKQFQREFSELFTNVMLLLDCLMFIFIRLYNYKSDKKNQYLIPLFLLSFISQHSKTLRVINCF